MLRPLSRPSGIATGANSAVLCRDIGLLTTPRRVNDRANTVSALADEPGLSALNLLTDCAGWPVDPVSRAQIQPVRSNAPVLLLSGRFDPTTPPAYAAAAARTLPHAQSVLFSSGTHVAYGTPCAAAIVDRFLRTGHANRPPCAGETLSI
jgi:pimeloyl-ACP methyl ester carboxylesterase